MKSLIGVTGFFVRITTKPFSPIWFIGSFISSIAWIVTVYLIFFYQEERIKPRDYWKLYN